MAAPIEKFTRKLVPALESYLEMEDDEVEIAYSVVRLMKKSGLIDKDDEKSARDIIEDEFEDDDPPE